MASLSWEEKLAAMQALGVEVRLVMRSPGDWYVSAHGRSIGDSGMLIGDYGKGINPEYAVLDDWRKCVDELRPDRYLVVRERRVRWNGFMWQEVR